VGAKPEEHSASMAPIELPSGRLHAVAFDYLKNHVVPQLNRTYLTTDGQIWLGSPPKVYRQGVSLDSPLPVLVTNKVHWGVRAPDGSQAFESF
jgi:hypothetical protein